MQRIRTTLRFEPKGMVDETWTEGTCGGSLMRFLDSNSSFISENIALDGKQKPRYAFTTSKPLNPSSLSRITSTYSGIPPA